MHSVLSTELHQTSILVLLLALLTPLWRLVNSIVLFLITLLLRVMYCGGVMLSRRVNSVQDLKNNVNPLQCPRNFGARKY